MSDMRRISVGKGAGVSETDYDVFICYADTDKELVRTISLKLMERGIKPWFDEWELRPGLAWQETLENEIERINSAAVFVGKMGIGPWQNRELRAFLEQFIRRGCLVIPVILPTAAPGLELPVFLRSFAWVDFRKTNPDPLAQLIWGIMGKRPILRTPDTIPSGPERMHA